MADLDIRSLSIIAIAVSLADALTLQSVLTLLDLEPLVEFWPELAKGILGRIAGTMFFMLISLHIRKHLSTTQDSPA